MKNRFRAIIVTALAVVGLLFGTGNILRSATPSASAITMPVLTGSYLADQGTGNYYAMYYVQQLSGTVWWAGFSMDPNLALDQQFHRGVGFTTVFRGTMSYDQALGAWKVSGNWADVSRGSRLASGTVTLKVDIDTSGNVSALETISQTGGFSATHWTPGTFPETPNLYDRFTQVEKSPDAGLIFQKPGSLAAEGLKPYRDETVFYGRVTATSIGESTGKTEVPHFDDAKVPATYKDFICDTSEDHDLDFNMGIDQGQFESNFASTGWDGRDPQEVLQKLYDSTAQSAARLTSNESYLHAEVVMYGHTANCTAATNGDTGRVLLPGYGDTGSNSVLVNGIPVNGNVTQLYGYDVNTQSYYKEGVKFNNQTFLPGDKIRITGAMILDCGHGDLSNPTGDCHLNNVYNPLQPSGGTCATVTSLGTIAYVPGDCGAQNQEIHPVYSIDVIHHNSAHTNLTGTWGGSDGSTFYVRQMGNTVWILGLYRDRQPLVPTGSSPPMPQYADVFTGTITHQPSGSDTIYGGGVDVPYPGVPGSNPFTANLDVNSATMITVSGASSGSGTPDFGAGFVLKKLYEPPDSTPPSSSLAFGPVYNTPDLTKTFVTSHTQFTVSAQDADSGAQNIWYRYYPMGSTAPAYTPVMGASGSFNITGTDGPYQVDYYATDNAGNDEAPHTHVFYLDTTPPNISITQPTATNYTHSQTLALNYTVDDGTGSGVQAVTPTMDGNATVCGQSFQCAQSIALLTSGLSLGSHTFTVNAVDNVGNKSSQSVTFTIIVTAQSIMDDVKQFVAAGAITQDEGTSLLSKLDSAAKARAAGNCPNAATIYQSFISEVQAQTGKKITASAASILIGDAQYLIAHCP